jgi:hypothetical protein
MPRTTVDIEAPLLAEMKQLQSREKKTLGQCVSEAVARYLAEKKSRVRKLPSFSWISHPLGLKVDIADKEAVYTALDAHGRRR